MRSKTPTEPGANRVPPHIDGCRFGLVVVDGRRYSRDVVILPDRVIPNWWREEGHALAVADLQALLDDQLQVLVVGLGHMGRIRLLPETSDWLAKRGLEVMAANTPAACEAYNRLRLERRVAAALHLTC